MIGTDTRKRSPGLARSGITLLPLLVCAGRHDLWGGGLSADSPVKHGTVFVETCPPGKWDCAGCGDRGGCVILWAREPMERDETNRYNIQHGRLTFEGFKLTNFSTRRIIGRTFIKLYEFASLDIKNFRLQRYGRRSGKLYRGRRWGPADCVPRL